METNDVVIDINEIEEQIKIKEEMETKKKILDEIKAGFKDIINEIDAKSFYDSIKEQSKHASKKRNYIYHLTKIITIPQHIFLYETFIYYINKSLSLKYCQKLRIKIGESFKIKNFDILNRFSIKICDEDPYIHTKNLFLNMKTDGDGMIMEKDIMTTCYGWSNFSEKELNISSSCFTFTLCGTAERSFIVDIFIEGSILHRSIRTSRIKPLSYYGFRELIHYVE